MDNPLELYQAIFISEQHKSAIFQYKDGKVYTADEYNNIVELPVSKIIDHSHGKVRFYTIIDGKKRWGVMQITGLQIIPPIYDYISPLIDEKYFKVFIGDYLWRFDDESHELFDQFLCDSSSWNGDQYKGRLGNGKWGLINTNNHILVPVEYQWIDLLDEMSVCCNVGDSPIIKWYHGDDKKDMLSIGGGLWKVIYLSRSWNIETELGNYFDVIRKFPEEYKKHTGLDYHIFSYESQKIHMF
ncbi:WG repeat-containing protein [Chryseobacterium sp.]|uniref:WG repeat-containing protein n=1 Tax=Chryseobacterium sp. TaxID=1871047 RepID=UPI0031DE341D